MSEQTVLLRLQGCMQAWGGAAPWSERSTMREPTKSGVVGLVGAALGIERGADRLASLAHSLRMAVRVDREGDLLEDFHTVGAGGEGVLTARRASRGQTVLKITDSTDRPEPEVSRRYYLIDAAFLVALSGSAPLIAEIDQALRRPRFLCFLGRANCLPTAPLAAGISDEVDPMIALQHAPLLSRIHTGMLRMVVECSQDEQGTVRMDVPLAPA